MQSKLVFVSINFEITILSTLTSENVIGFFVAENVSFAIFSLQISTILYYEQNL